MNIPRDPREGVSSTPESGMDAPTFTALHYALATKVDAIVDRQVELTKNIADVSSEMRMPKPQPWGSIITLVIGILAIMGTIGGLVHQSIADRIAVNDKEIREVEARSEKRDGMSVSKEQYNDSITLLRETAKRLEEVQIIQRKTEQEISVTKAEFVATINGLAQRQIRNESLIEEARKADGINNRLNQLYELYRQLQSQAQSLLAQQAQQAQQYRNGNSK